MEIATHVLNKLKKFGWTDYSGRSMSWYQWQRPNHNNQFDEPKEPKEKKKKFKKESD